MIRRKSYAAQGKGKRMKKKVLAVLAVVMMIGWTAGCGAASGGSADKYAMEESAVAEAPEAAAWDAGGYEAEITSENGIESVQKTSQKLIKTVNLDIQTREFEELTGKIAEKVKELGGYIESSSVWGNSYYSNSTRNADYTLRIPSDKLDQFVQEASELGNVTYKNESIEDVTLQYVDVESRKAALEVSQKRLLELLEQAESMEDILTIESKLSEVRYELENYGSRLRVLDNQIDYSTVYLSINEVERITPVGEKSFFEEVADRFGDSVYRVTKGLRSLAIDILGGLPILAVWAVIIAIVVFVVHKIRGTVKKKKEAKEEKKDASENK